MKTMSKNRLGVLVSVGVLCAAVGNAEICSQGVMHFIAQSSTICAGTLTSFQIQKLAGGSTNSWLLAEIAVDHKIKGFFESDKVMVQISEVPLDFSQSLDPKNYDNKRWLFFLKPVEQCTNIYRLVHNPDSMIPVSCQHKSVIEVSADVDSAVENEFLVALDSDDLVIRSTAFGAIEDWGRKSPGIMGAFKKISIHEPSPLKGRAIAQLIRRADLESFSSAFLYHGTESEMRCIGAAVADVVDTNRVSGLMKFAKADDVYLRRGAVCALRKMVNCIKDVTLISVFRAALDDSDRDVQYDALFCLNAMLQDSASNVVVSARTNRYHMTMRNIPSRDVFDQDPDKFIREQKEFEGMRKALK